MVRRRHARRALADGRFHAGRADLALRLAMKIDETIFPRRRSLTRLQRARAAIPDFPFGFGLRIRPLRATVRRLEQHRFSSARCSRPSGHERLPTMLYGHNSIRLWVGKRMEQHAIHRAEDGRIRADPERQRHKGDNRETRTFRERAQAKPNVTPQAFHHASSRPRFPGQKHGPGTTRERVSHTSCHPGSRFLFQENGLRMARPPERTILPVCGTGASENGQPDGFRRGVLTTTRRGLSAGN